MANAVDTGSGYKPCVTIGEQSRALVLMTVTTHIRPVNDRKPALILTAIAASEGIWLALNIYSNPKGFFRFSGMLPFRGTLSGWILALLVAAAFVYQASRLPSVRANLVRPSFLKVLALAVAIASGFCEELVFRKMWMDYLQRHGLGVALQILFSALAFGLVHSVWALFRGSVWAGFAATVATGVLGLGLAIVYVASGRVVAACIVSHFLINLFVEPGLVLAALRGEMGAAH